MIYPIKVKINREIERIFKEKIINSIPKKFLRIF